MRLLAGALANAVATFALQAVALISLGAVDYGRFSLQYLVFALGSSLTLSLIAEPWLRAQVHDEVTGAWREYSGALSALSLVAGAAAVIVSIAVGADPLIVVLIGLSVLLSTYRVGARFHTVRIGDNRRAAVADIASVAGTVASWAVALLCGVRGPELVAIVWFVGSALSVALSARPRLSGPRALRDWVVAHRHHIGPLLRDSTLTDAGSIGTPYVIAPLLGLAQFGVYRAVANTSAPVRLVLNPMRSQLAARPLAWHAAVRRVALVVGAAVLTGVLCWLALFVVDVASLQLGVLSELTPFALLVSGFVVGSFLMHYFSIVARTHFAGRRLLGGRIVQTVLAIVLPIPAAILGGLPWAIAAYTAATVLAAVWWLLLVVRMGRRAT